MRIPYVLIRSGVGILVAGGITGTGVALSYSGLFGPKSQESTYEFKGNESFPAFSLTCINREGKFAFIELDSTSEDLIVRCNYHELRSSSAPSEELEIEFLNIEQKKQGRLTCKLKDSNQYLCSFVDIDSKEVSLAVQWGEHIGSHQTREVHLRPQGKS
ncbi:hypothetical protein MHLP_02705 [Candidatus Mycoplasma haematolamae str. Purdue]|uniref:Uncharacterized protein n=1 Tax=Mycoplasma haematolamae (strain Purdue) TaxID=1212765 RepID=I7CFW9_MYCHA|nr:hypothetical protein [Candidatus Mycoplasma haematolamae]AFO52121.1 hypothetical protein MHLP_02705 [Candidatus Mycoplasma haematolamae str. Purdue]